MDERAGLPALQAVLERALGPEAKDGIMTAGQELIQQGAQHVVLRLLRLRFGDAVNTDVEQRITTASMEQIDTWCLRVLSAASLTELLAN